MNLKDLQKLFEQMKDMERRVAALEKQKKFKLWRKK